MTNSQSEFIDVSRLRIGHFVFIDLGWISHPFPLSSFKIHSCSQIETIRSLGIERIRYSPERSDPEPGQENASAPAASPDDDPGSPENQVKRRRRELIAEQRASLQACERLFNDASRSFRLLAESAHAQPLVAREVVQTVVAGMVGEVIGEQESCIRLLSEKVGERSSLHAINVTVISLLLGKACGLDEAALHDLGVGALLHDVGKIDLPDRLRYQNEHLTTAEQQLYQEHVRYGTVLGKKMKLSKGALLVIGQHHECADGSGYPLHIRNDRLAPAARIVSLVDRYDNLCNPGNPALALTPHEALSQIYSQAKHRFDGTTLSIFIRMMGVYPPGSVIQLSDERYALVVSVNSARPLKPRVIIHEPGVPRDEALVVDLAAEPTLGIRRAVRPLQLPRAAIDYLSPRQRVCYFFEHARGVGDEGGAG